MLVQMERLTVHWDEDLRLDPANQLLQLRPARVSGDVHKMRAVSDDFDSLLDKKIDNSVHCFLVARNSARGINHAVAGRECHLRVLVFGNAREGRARLALAAS